MTVRLNEIHHIASTVFNFGGWDQNTYAEDIYVGYRYYETFAPEKVLYPFGFGLSYTTFYLETRGRLEEDGLVLDVTVGNTGTRPGREVVQVYAQPPQGKLGKPLRNLAAFRKTGILAPGETQTLTFRIGPEDLASFDDSGVTGNPYAYVLEPGEYTLYVGTDVRSAAPALSWKLEKLRLVRQLSAQASPAVDFKRLRPKAQGKGFAAEYEPVPRAAPHRKEDILTKMPREIPYTGDKGILFGDVCAGKKRKSKLLLPEELAEEVSRIGKAAVVFGNERTGLTDSELEECTLGVTIPSHKDFASLNLSHAVQVICYTLFRQAEKRSPGYTPVTLERLDKTVSVIADDLQKIGFFSVTGRHDMEMFWRGLLSRSALSEGDCQYLEKIFHKAAGLAWKHNQQNEI